MVHYRVFFWLKFVLLIMVCLCFIPIHVVLGQGTDDNPTEQKYHVFLPLAMNFVSASEHVEKAVAEASLLATIVPEKPTFSSSEKILLRFTMTNTSESLLYILKWGTPFDGFKQDLFVVTTQATRVPYVGKLVKRGAPSQNDYFSLKPGEQRAVVIDMSEGYAIQERGDYNVQFVSQLLDVRYSAISTRVQRMYHPLQVMRPSTHFTLLEGREKNQLRSIESPTGFSNCSNSQQQDVTAALQSAISMATNASNVFQNVSTPAQAARYITWFGPHDNTRYSTVQAHFKSISNALSTQSFDWDCHPTSGCNPGDFAYVYSNAPYKIYLCSSFWAVGNTGTDSRPGTIIHETSHFSVVAATSDNFYGHDTCIDSAQTKPGLAMNNADSHEYFAEDVEALPMASITDLVHVRFSHASTEIGTIALPYNTVGEGVSAIANGGVLRIESGSTDERLQISKPMTLEAINGTVTIGQ